MDSTTWIEQRTEAAMALAKLLDAIRAKHDAARAYERVLATTMEAEGHLTAAAKQVDEMRVKLATIIDRCEVEARPL